VGEESCPPAGKGRDEKRIGEVMVEEKQLGWEVHEPGDQRADAEAMNATVIADRFKGSHGKVPENYDSAVWTCIPVLQFLWGRPWNNMALNYVTGLRPSMVRVTLGEVTCDSYTWRVTVYLEEDMRTIKKIEQEVQTWSIGCRYGADLMLHLERFKDKPVLEQDDFPSSHGGVVNIAAVRKLGLHKG
jgi:hypothetical protein